MRLVWRDAHPRSQFAFSLVHIPGNQHTTVVATISSSRNQECRARLVWNADRKKGLKGPMTLNFCPRHLGLLQNWLWYAIFLYYNKYDAISIFACFSAHTRQSTNFIIAVVATISRSNMRVRLAWNADRKKGLIGPTAVNSRPRLPQ